MSYILDALRRAEADRERERGQVPGLHTQALSDGDTAAGGVRRRWLPWAGAGVLLLAGVGAGSWWAGTASAPPAPPPPPAPVMAAAPTPPAPAPAPASAVPPEPAASASPYLPPAPPPAPVPAPLPAPAPAPVAVAAPPPVVAAPAPAPTPEARIPRLAELPEAVRRELPRLAISGSVYSDDPASRFVIVNGEVMREGARLGPDLVLEQIGARELVLRYKGQRFRQPV